LIPKLGLTPEYLTLYGLKLKEGRFFDLEKDKDREEKVVLNETALKMFGFTSLGEAELESQYWGKGWKVIGVVEDFRYFPDPNFTEALPDIEISKAE